MLGKGLYHPPVHFHQKMPQWRKLTAEEQKAEHEKEGVRAQIAEVLQGRRKSPRRHRAVVLVVEVWGGILGLLPLQNGERRGQEKR